jgi:hypothetical protein
MLQTRNFLGTLIFLTVAIFVHQTSAYAKEKSQIALKDTGPSSPSFFGRWEIVSTIHSSKLPPRQAGLPQNSIGTANRVIELQNLFTVQRNLKTTCQFDPKSTTSNLPLGSIFRGEPAARKAPKWISEKFDDRLNNYRLEGVSAKTVTVYRYECPTSDNANNYLNNAGNWFAIAGDTMIFPSNSSWLFILKRQPRHRDAAHEVFCNRATSEVEKAICEDREMWVMQDVATRFKSCFFESNRVAQLEALNQTLEQSESRKLVCGPKRDCIYEELQTTVDLIAQSMPRPKETCARKTVPK